MTQYTKGQRVRLIRSGTDDNGAPEYGGFEGIQEFGNYLEAGEQSSHLITTFKRSNFSEETLLFLGEEFTTELIKPESIWSDKVEAARLRYEGAQRLADQAQEFADKAKAELNRLEEEEAK